VADRHALAAEQKIPVGRGRTRHAGRLAFDLPLIVLTLDDLVDPADVMDAVLLGPFIAGRQPVSHSRGVDIGEMHRYRRVGSRSITKVFRRAR
jgi:hypothetical protein